MRRFWRNLALFLGGLLLAAVPLYAVVPHDRPLLEAMFGEAESCEALLIGPSFIASGIREDAFDEEARRIGLELDLCKYAIPALSGYELKHTIGFLLDRPWPKLKYVLIDVTLGATVQDKPSNYWKPRLVEWHVFRSLPWLYRNLDKKSGGLAAQAGFMWTHVQHVAVNYLGIGRGVFTLAKLRSLYHPPRVPPAKPFRRAETGQNYDKKLRRMIREKARVRASGQTDSNTWHKELGALVKERASSEALFLISPVMREPRPPVNGATEGRGRLTVFDFQDPARYPDLYTPDVRGESSHLAGDGPVFYSRHLARRLHDYHRRP